jgi:hypothetical protein
MEDPKFIVMRTFFKPNKVFYHDPKVDLFTQVKLFDQTRPRPPQGGIDNELADTPQRNHSDWRWTKVVPMTREELT